MAEFSPQVDSGTTISRAETAPRTVIKKLNIAVHPGFIHVPQNPALLPNFEDARGRLFGGITDRLTPQNANEALMIMPAVRREETLLTNVHRAQDAKEQYPNLKQWPDLLRQLREEVKSRGVSQRNVFLGPDIVIHATPAAEVFNRIAQRGFQVDDATVITIGGELLDACVSTAAHYLLLLPQVHNIRIDLRAAITGGYTGSDRSMQYVMDRFDHDRYELHLDEVEGYLTVTKKPEAIIADLEAAEHISEPSLPVSQMEGEQPKPIEIDL